MVARLGVAAPARFARCAKLTPGAVAPRRASEGVEGVTGGTQRGAGVGDAALSSQPLAVREEEARALEGPAVEVGGEHLVEALGGIVVGGEQRAGMAHAERDPACG